MYASLSKRQLCKQNKAEIPWYHWAVCVQNRKNRVQNNVNPR